MAYRPSSDKILLATVGFLTIFGLVMVFSSSTIRATNMDRQSYYFFLRQLISAVAGFAVLLALLRMDYHHLQKKWVLIPILASLALTLAVMLFLPGKGRDGDIHRWLDLGFITVQPSEFAKLAVLLFLAWFFQKPENDIRRDEKHLVVPCVAIVLFAGLIYLGKDMGQAAMLCLLGGILLVIAGLRWRWIAGFVVLSLSASYLAILAEPYRLKRITAFSHPEDDPLKSGLQILQSLIAVGSGGFSGLGLGGSKQKFLFLPEAHTDFIFAVIAEELGLIGATIVIIAFLIFFWRGMKIALNSHDRFGFYLAMGITFMVVVQGFISITMVLGLLPTKGIALPFISYGGSSLLMNLAATGILLNLSYQNRLAGADK
ncbi:MAG: putative lipid II flippase FtsW [Acidobacteriota bacterium]|jgi:cell division protein FtsW|nr:putative lipid II flippase FtsW [Acidobacteriota bacterium]